MRSETALVSMAVLSSHGVTTEVRLARLESLDLSDIKRKLREPEPEGKAWSQEQCDEAEKWYKRYLATIIKFPEATCHVPNGPIDAFWHQHILDTRAYARDCEHVMGYFLHHYPYFGLNGDAQERDDSFDETNELYRIMFGEDCKSMSFGKKKGQDCGGDACHGGGTCNPCTVDGDRAPRSDTRKARVGMGCTGNACIGGTSCNAARTAQCDGEGGDECERVAPCKHTTGRRAITDQNQNDPSHKASQCNSGCGQGCLLASRALMSVAVGSSCNHKGSGTGCGQRCRRG